MEIYGRSTGDLREIYGRYAWRRRHACTKRMPHTTARKEKYGTWLGAGLGLGTWLGAGLGIGTWLGAGLGIATWLGVGLGIGIRLGLGLGLGTWLGLRVGARHLASSTNYFQHTTNFDD